MGGAISKSSNLNMGRGQEAFSRNEASSSEPRQRQVDGGSSDLPVRRNNNSPFGCFGVRPRAPVPSKQSAEYVCEQIRNQRHELIDFRYIDSLKNIPVIKNQYKNTTVSQYRADKNYPSSPLDVRPTSIDFKNFCAHGTNLSSVISALVHTNQQLVPGVKARKLGVKFDTGENRELTFSDVNRKYVSTVTMNTRTSRLDEAVNYAQLAADKSSSSHRSNRLKSDSIPVVVFGDGAGDLQTINSSVRNEVLFKRVNIRMLAVADGDKEFVEATLRHLNIDDVKVIPQEEIDTDSYAPPDVTQSVELQPEDYWRNLWVQAR